MRQNFVAAAVAALMLWPGAGFAQNPLDKLVTAAKQEHELTFVAAGSTFGGNKAMSVLEAGFNKKFGLRMKLHFVPGPNMAQVAARILQEYKAGAKATTDVYLGPAASFALLKKEGALSEVDWAGTFPWLTPEMEITRHYGVLVRTTITGIVYNPALIKPAEAPTKNEDLIDPAKSKTWAGKMAMPPYPDWLVELSIIWPKEKVLDFARKLTSVAGGFIRYDEDERVVNGEFAVMANEADGPEVTALWASRGARLEFVPGSDPAEAYYFQLGVPKNSASPNLATLFAAYVASPEGQAVLNRSFQGSHLVPSTYEAEYMAKAKLRLISPRQYTDFYEQGGDPELSAQIKQLLKR